MRKIFLMLLTMTLSVIIHAQEITGVVVDQNGTPVVGANVQAKKSNTYTATDFDGNFSIKATVGEDLEFSMIGMKTLIVKATKETMNVVMIEEVSTLSEVVVIGYGNAKKKDLTGSIVKINGDEVADKPNTNPVNSLQGKVSGLSIVNTGKPGEEPDVRIRGTVSITQTKPLYVVDGMFTDNINYLNPNDIESIDVLKDPSSLAIFGVRGANGVIVVTTKKGKLDSLSVNFNSSIGVKNVVSFPKMTNASQFKELYAESLVNDGLPEYEDFDIYTANTNWAKLITQKNALISSNNISLSSGSDKNRIYFGAGYYTEDGVIKNEQLKKFTINLSDDIRLSDKFKIGIGFSGYRASLPQLHDYVAAMRATPIYAPYNDEYGAYYQAPSAIGGPQIMNPLMNVEVANNGTKLSKEYRFLGNIFGEYKLLQDLTFRIEYMADLGFNNERSYNAGTYPVYAADLLEESPENRVVMFGTSLSSVNQYQNQYQKFQQDYLLTYKKSFGDHGITAMAGITTYYSDYLKTTGSVKAKSMDDPIPNDPRFWYLNVTPWGDSTTKVSDSEEWQTSTLSYLSRILYNYQEKYMLNASYRIDGSSDISPDNRYGHFWTIGAAWDVTKEKFMENQKLFDLLKLKGSYGKLGNQYAKPYPYYPTYYTDASNTAIFDGVAYPALALKYKFNSKLDWEKLYSYEFGFETEMLSNRLNVEAVYYNKKTKDLITFIEGNDKFYVNSGEIENHGVEFSAKWTDNINDNFSYFLGANITTLNNKVVKTYKEGYGQFYGSSSQSRFEAGMPVGAFYGYVVEGVYQSNADILLSPITTNTVQPGDLKFKDVNEDGKITPDDRTYLGDPTPDFTYGFNAGFTKKNFEFSVDVQGVYGNEIWREWGPDSGYAQFNYRIERLDRWNGAGTSNWEPRIATSSNNSENSSYFIEDGSYIRLRNINLGYNFNSNILKQLKLNNFKIFANVQNLYTWKWNSGFTPEAGGTATAFGIDNGGYPLPRITSIGINVSF